MPDSQSSNSPYPHLLSLIDVGAMTLPNRVIMGSMHTLIERLDRPRERLAAFYGLRARGGAALIVTGGVSPNEYGGMDEHTSVPMNEDQAEAYRFVTDAGRANARGIELAMAL